MIFNLLADAGTLLINFLLSLFPASDINIVNSITEFLSGFRQAMSAISWFFPVNTALSFLAIIFTIEASIFLFKLIRWIASNISVGVLK